MRKFLIVSLVLGMSSTAGAALSLVPGDLTLSGAGDRGTIQVVSDADGGYGCLIELVDLTIADYDGDPTFTPEGNPNGDSHVHKFDAHVYDFIVSSINPGAPILAGVHINVNLIGVAEGVTTLDLYDISGMILLDSATVTVLPEPMTIAMLGLGGLFLLRRRK
jgi:hypothetical protein